MHRAARTGLHFADAKGRAAKRPHEGDHKVFDEGLGFDGSSIRGWMPIHNSDMLVVPDADTAVMDPFMKDPTLSLICNIVDPVTREPYTRDPRFVAPKAEKHLRASGIGDAAYFGPEAEFFIFDGISYDSGVNHASYKIESREGQWATGSPTETTYDGKTAGTRPNLGYKPRYKEGYFPVAPIDSQQDLRTLLHGGRVDDCPGSQGGPVDGREPKAVARRKPQPPDAAAAAVRSRRHRGKQRADAGGL